MTEHVNLPIRSLGTLATITSGGTPDRANGAYWNGAIPWVKTTLIQNGTIRADDIDEHITDEGLRRSSAKIIPSGSILMAMIGQGKTRGQVALLDVDAAVNQNCAAILLNQEVDRNYVFQQLRYRYEEIRNISNSSGQQNLNAVLIRSIKLPMPDLSQQRKIGKLLTEWDTAIEKTNQLIAAKGKRHAWLLQLLISTGKARHHWETVELGSIVTERSEKSVARDQYPVMTSSRRGLFLQSEYFTKQVTSEDNTGYKVMHRGDFTFRSMSDDGHFAFNRLTTLDAGLISPAYGVFYATGCYPEYLAHFLNSSYFANALNRESQGGTRKALRFSSIAQIEIDFPSIPEQERIAGILDTSLREIEIEKKRLALLVEQKRGLMQKLLTGQWRVKAPEDVEVT